MDKQSISLELYKLLDEAYAFFNEKLFSNELPETIVVLHRKRNARGYFHAERYIERTDKKKKNIKSWDELAMNPDDFDLPDIAILSTLVHEMVHVWRFRKCEVKYPRGGYHDKHWANEMERIGLMPSTTGREGGKRTGQKVTHYIIKDGPFEKKCLQFLKGKSIKLSSFQLLSSTDSSKRNKIKYSCPSCGMNVWGKPGVNVDCGDCGEKLEGEE